jgi:TRAP-type C4-dicarboxylate transport system permease small subunit
MHREGVASIRMSQETTVVLIVAKATTLIFGGALTLLAYRAFRRTGAVGLKVLGIGIGLLTAGALVGGVLHQLVGVPLNLSVTVQSVFTAVGFAVMTYSLFTDVTQPSDRTRSGSRTGD